MIRHRGLTVEGGHALMAVNTGTAEQEFDWGGGGTDERCRRELSWGSGSMLLGKFRKKGPLKTL